MVVVEPMQPLDECEIQARLADGSEARTTPRDLGSPATPGALVRRKSAGVDAVWEAHKRHLTEVRGDREMEPAPTTLAGFACLLDGGARFTRQQGLPYTHRGPATQKHREATFDVVDRLKSGRRDLNPRPPEPHSGALPDCATSRKYYLPTTYGPSCSAFRRGVSM
jgi:hypothetical protein